MSKLLNLFNKFLSLNRFRHTQNSEQFLKQFKKFDSKGQVVEINKNEIKKFFLAGSTSGGQKANRSKSLVHLIHLPTNISSDGRVSRNVVENLEYAMAELRMKVDIEMKGDESIFKVTEKIEKEKIEKEKEIKVLKYKKQLEKEERLKKLLEEKDLIIY